MDLLSPESVLICLPTLIPVWTGITLTWGIILASFMQQMMSHADVYKGGRRKDDIHCAKTVWLASILLFVFLFLSPKYASTFSDAILVINVFLTGVYINCSIGVIRWLKTKQAQVPKPLLT